MFSTLPSAQTSMVFQLAREFSLDKRPAKIDLGIGVYRNAAGETPVFASVKAAERQLVEQQNSKSYLGLAGEPAFNQQLAALVLGEVPENIAAVQSTGGTAALRIAFELIKSIDPAKRVWLPNLTWANHNDILDQLDIAHSPYPYYVKSQQQLDFSGLCTTLRSAAAGDVVLLHGCCHNPSGADLTPQQWRELAQLLAERQLIPLVDLAYLGFGDNLADDAFGTRALARKLPEMMIAISCSKNFGLYRERTGALLTLTKDADSAERTQAMMARLTRLNYSMSPDHGARTVLNILSQSALKTQWEEELTQMRQRISKLRSALVEQFRRRTNTDAFSYIAAQKGMFSLLPLSPAQIALLKEKYAIYLLPNGRINIAGLKEEQIAHFVDAVLNVQSQ